MNPPTEEPFASAAAEAAYQQAQKDGVPITRFHVRRMLQAFDLEYGEHDPWNDYPERSTAAPVLAAALTEQRVFIDMLTRAGIGHGLRHDNNPPGTAVLVECDDSDDARQWAVCEFFFNEDGTLKTTSVYDGEED